MQKYGLKINSKFDLTDTIKIVADNDFEINSPGVYEILCNKSLTITHNVSQGLAHVYAVSHADDIAIAINSQIEAREDVDVYHEIKAEHKNVRSDIQLHAALFDNTKLIYRSNLAAGKHAEGVGSQKAKVLYVGENSGADIIPHLDIQGDTFKTSHSVSISSFDEKQKFYLSLHGLDGAAVEEFIINSFLNKETQIYE